MSYEKKKTQIVNNPRGQWHAVSLQKIKRLIEKYRAQFHKENEDGHHKKFEINRYINDKLESKFQRKISTINQTFINLDSTLPQIRDSDMEKLEKSLGEFYYLSINELKEKGISIKKILDGSPDIKITRKRKFDSTQMDVEEKAPQKKRFCANKLKLGKFLKIILEEKNRKMIAKKMGAHTDTLDKYLKGFNITIDQVKNFAYKYSSSEEALIELKRKVGDNFNEILSILQKKEIKLDKVIGHEKPWRTKEDIYFYEICEALQVKFTIQELANHLGTQKAVLNSFFKRTLMIPKRTLEQACKNLSKLKEDVNFCYKKTLLEISSSQEDRKRIYALYGNQNKQPTFKTKKLSKKNNLDIDLENIPKIEEMDTSFFYNDEQSQPNMANIEKYSLKELREIYAKIGNPNDSVKSTSASLLKELGYKARNRDLLYQLFKQNGNLNFSYIFFTDEAYLIKTIGEKAYNQPLSEFGKAKIDLRKNFKETSHCIFWKTKDTAKNNILNYSPHSLKCSFKKLRNSSSSHPFKEKLEKEFNCSTTTINKALRPYGFTISSLLKSKINIAHELSQKPFNQQEENKDLKELLTHSSIENTDSHEDSSDFFVINDNDNESSDSSYNPKKG